MVSFHILFAMFPLKMFALGMICPKLHLRVSKFLVDASVDCLGIF
jgi:hypothetical protein